MPARRRRTGPPPRARCRGGVPPLSLQRPARGPLLAGRRRRATRRAAVHVRPARAARPARAPAGKWTDAATGEHGDLLDLIALSLRLRSTSATSLDEARRFLSLPRPNPEPRPNAASRQLPRGSPEAARRLFAMSQPIAGTLVETYLRSRGITALHAGGRAALPSALLLSPRRGQRRPRPGRR